MEPGIYIIFALGVAFGLISGIVIYRGEVQALRYENKIYRNDIREINISHPAPLDQYDPIQQQIETQNQEYEQSRLPQHEPDWNVIHRN